MVALLPSILPMLLIAGITYTMARDQSLGNSERLALIVAGNGASELNSFLETQNKIFQKWTQNDIYGPMIQRGSAQLLHERFREMLDTTPEFRLLAIADNSGRVLEACASDGEAETLIGKDAAEAGLLSKEVRQSIVLADSGLLTELGDPVAKTFIYYFYTHDASGRINGTFMAYLDISGVQLRVANVQNILANSNFPDAKAALVENETSLALAHSVSEKILTKIDMPDAVRTWINTADELDAKEIKPFTVERVNEYIAYEPVLKGVSNLSGGTANAEINSVLNLMVFIPETNIFSEVQKMLKLSAVISGIGVALLMLLIWVTAQRIANPIKKVTDLIKAIAEGRADLTERIHSARTDEIGQLTESSDVLLQNLYQLSQTAEKVAGGDLTVNVSIRSENDTLSKSFNRMTVELHKSTNDLVEVFEHVSSGDLSVKANENTNNKLFDKLGKAVNLLIESQLEIIETVKRVAQGNLNESVKVRSEKDDLSISFNLMVTSLKNLVMRVKEQADAIAGSSRELSQISEQTNQTVIQLSAMSSQISSATSSVAQSVQDASKSSQSAQSSSQSGRALMSGLVEKIKVVKGFEEQSARVMNELTQSSIKIGEIVNVITKIADQTNLLALNAAIEAARAGEAGRGFAVVADEVRKLAESSANSAQEISNIVRLVQDETRRAAAAVTEGTRDMDRSVELTEQSSAYFMNIVAQVETVTHVLEGIAASAEETAASSEESTASTAEQKEAMQGITNISKGLSSAVNVLIKASNQFKY